MVALSLAVVVALSSALAVLVERALALDLNGRAAGTHFPMEAMTAMALNGRARLEQLLLEVLAAQDLLAALALNRRAPPAARVHSLSCAMPHTCSHPISPRTYSDDQSETAINL